MTAISIITIVKNNEALLRRAANSVLEQDFPNLEYIIVNDGSTDNTATIIDELAVRDTRVKPVHQEKNVGRARARNAGLNKAIGKYVFFLDSDDYLPATALGDLHKVAEEEEADIVYGAIKAFDKDAGEWKETHYRNGLITCDRRKVRLEDHLPLLHNNSVINCLYRNAFIKDRQLCFSTERKNGEDVAFAFYSAFHASSISLAPQIVSYYYSLGNFLDTANESKLIDARDNILETHRYAIQYGSQAIKDEMYRKCAIFGSELARAEKVYGSGVALRNYIPGLYPLFENTPTEVFEKLPKYSKTFSMAMTKGDFALAYETWLKRTSKTKMVQKNKPITADFGFNPNGPEVPTIAEEANRFQRLAREFAEAGNSASWKIAAPLIKFKTRTHILKPKVSVIIPIYNMEQWLGDCLESVVNQTLVDIEIICVNDCSPDGSSAIVERYAKSDKRIKLIHRKENGGLAATRNSGIEVAEGEYLFFLDADDMLFDNSSLTHLYNIAYEYDADEVIGATYKWHEESNEIYLDNHTSYLKCELRNVTLKRHPEIRNNIIACNKLIKQDFLARNWILYFQHRLRRFEDNPFSWKAHVLAQKICVTRKPTYIFRQPPGKADYFLNKIFPYLNYHIEAIEELFRFFSEQPYRVRSSRYLIEGLYAIPLIHAANNYASGHIDKEAFVNLCRQYAPLFARLPRRSFKALPRRIREVVRHVQGPQFDKRLGTLLQKIASRKERVQPIYNYLSPCMQRFPFKINPANLDALIAKSRNGEISCEIDKMKNNFWWKMTASLGS